MIERIDQASSEQGVPGWSLHCSTGSVDTRQHGRRTPPAHTRTRRHVTRRHGPSAVRTSSESPERRQSESCSDMIRTVLHLRRGLPSLCAPPLRHHSAAAIPEPCTQPDVHFNKVPSDRIDAGQPQQQVSVAAMRKLQSLAVTRIRTANRVPVESCGSGSGSGLGVG